MGHLIRSLTLQKSVEHLLWVGHDPCPSARDVTVQRGDMPGTTSEQEHTSWLLQKTRKG